MASSTADLRVLFAVSECAPLLKTGGLADVAGSLPIALAGLGVDVRILVPGYRPVLDHVADARPLWSTDLLFGGPVRVVSFTCGARQMLVLDAPHLFDRNGGPYTDPDGQDWPDNDLRFGALSQVAALIGRGALSDGWQPDLLHCHDWQTGLVPVYLTQRQPRPVTVFSIHNMAYTGNFMPGTIPRLGLPPTHFTTDGFEFWGNVSMLKAGLVFADALSTVSESYARELKDPAFGHGLEGVVRARATDMTGIVNGIDLEVWSPATDPEIAPYDVSNLSKRLENRTRLILESGLDPVEGPIMGVVSRLTSQKGLDLLAEALPRLFRHGGALVMLGSGDAELEALYRGVAAENPGRVAVTIGYDEALSHRIYAGADLIAVPSRFEPCGLTQLYALRYGALPMVARTGGLADTVIDWNPAARAAGVATGFVHTPGRADAVAEAIDRALACWSDPVGWQVLQRNAMAQPVGWENSAQRYLALYHSLAGCAD